MKNSILLFLLPLLLTCKGEGQPTAGAPAAPSEVSASALSPTEALLVWKDNADSEEGYYVFANAVQPFATLPAGSTQFRFTDLEPEKTYTFGVQAFANNGALSLKVTAEPVTTPAPEPEPEPDPNPVEPLSFQWTEVEGLDLPATVKVFKTESTLNGRPLQAWYAVADCTGDIKLRVLFPGKGNKKTIDKQAEEDGKCLVLVNGGIFGTWNNGLAVCDGEQTPWARVEDDNWDVDRQYWGPDKKLHTISRGLAGVDQNGVPGVYWSYTPSHGTVYVYDQPIPTVAGGPVQQGGTDTFPCPRADWTPYNAITCGPVLLQGGKCPINKKKTSAGYWETNYELWADDIYGVEVLADRTAVGYLPDGRVILLIVDGRISTSQGATTLEMAAIMKGLGCEGALNLDGGGSTGMWTKGGGHLNDLTAEANRPVLTTIGFFEK